LGSLFSYIGGGAREHDKKHLLSSFTDETIMTMPSRDKKPVKFEVIATVHPLFKTTGA
jgi:hypothetical protein